ncbi:P-loop containing nucleoside triphosphate hydrolases superfamily protein [Euphorbia peplus]|nr:P-loop containing nucleoside triphosphate hydrolases superfamily protein [Euphorbia peplus]
MEEASKDPSICWRNQVEYNLKRLHSLQFGLDLALVRGDFSTAYILGLRLIGFLDSHSDDVLTRPIRREAILKLDKARLSLVPESDRRPLEQAGRSPDHVCSKKLDIDIEKIKESKYFRALVQKCDMKTSNRTGDEVAVKEELRNKPSKLITQAKLTSLYGSNMLKAYGGSHKSSLKSKRSNVFNDVEMADSHHSHPRSHNLVDRVKNEESERTYGNSGVSKRTHEEIRSPRIDSLRSPSSNEDANTNGFVTARAKLEMDAKQKRGLMRSPSTPVSPQNDNLNRGSGVRPYAYTRSGARGNFVPPIKSNGSNNGNMIAKVAGNSGTALDDSVKRCLEMLCGPDGELPEKLRNLEPRLIEHVSNEIMDRDPNVRWDDIAGLEHAKKCVTEMVIWPLIRPDIFKGCRSPGRGLLLFGPPGTGKTMIGKAIAGEAKATFFYISASSLTSKWIGEGEKLVRALFGVASCRQPAVIFVDEIDSLLSQRKSEGEHESSRRLKTQFLIEMEGFDSGSEQILLVGATNRPQELDEAARRRLTKRLYIPLPSSEARAWIIRNLLQKDGLFKLSEEDIISICNMTEGYSGSDMKNLVKDASMGPLREALTQGIEITKLKKEDMRPVSLQDFEMALQEVRPSVSLSELGTYDVWNKQFGSLAL